MALGLVPGLGEHKLLNALEVTGIEVDGLGVSTQSQVAWTGSPGAISGTTTGKAKRWIFPATAGNTTLTLSNNKTVSAQLFFDYSVTLNGGTVSIDGTPVTTSGNFSKELQPGETLDIFLKTRVGAYTT